MNSLYQIHERHACNRVEFKFPFVDVIKSFKANTFNALCIEHDKRNQFSTGRTQKSCVTLSYARLNLVVMTNLNVNPQDESKKNAFPFDIANFAIFSRLS